MKLYRPRRENEAASFRFVLVTSSLMVFMLLGTINNNRSPLLQTGVHAFEYSTLPACHFRNRCHQYKKSITSAKRERECSSWFLARHNGILLKSHQTPQDETKDTTDHNDDDDDDNNYRESIVPLLELASAHCTSQALHTFVQLGIPDILGVDGRRHSLEYISKAIGPTTNTNALLRCLRLLTTVEIVHQEIEKEDDDNGESAYYFSLSKTGKLLASSSKLGGGMAACIQHWMEAPLWDAWLELPSYIRGSDSDDKKNDGDNEDDAKNRNSNSIINNSGQFPFDRANNGVSSDYYYNAQDHPQSLAYANEFVKFIFTEEINAIVELEYWKTKTQSIESNGNNDDTDRRIRVVDIGGHHGQVMRAVHEKYPHDLDVYSLDLPEVIESYYNKKKADDNIDSSEEPVTLIAGNIFDPSTIPKCDVIFMKHFLDRCMWTEDETVTILQTCRTAAKTILIAEAVLPDATSSSVGRPSAELSMDALYMLVGREGQRTELEWRDLARRAGCRVDAIIKTTIPSCSIIIMERYAEETTTP